MDTNNVANTGIKLHQANLSSLQSEIAVPTYRRDHLTPSILHIGVGGFHRAHLAVYLDDLAQQGITQDWGERGIGLLPVDKRMSDVLTNQDFLYTLVTRSGEEDIARVIGSMQDYLYAPDNASRVLEAMTNKATRIVSLTITEGGYNVDTQTGLFKADNLGVQKDLRDPNQPQTVFGYICEALDRRRRDGLPPFTVMSCDNLQGNGQITRAAITSFARLRDEKLAAWIEANVAFPNGMVDRITPQTTDADRQLVTHNFGIQDSWPVMSEPFRQWVIEDTFCNGRPPLEKVGVQVVSNVHPYETMKLRLLNASHQAMGYLGYLAGYRYIHHIMEDATFRTFIRRMMDEEITPLLPPVPGIDLDDYKATLIERFSNPKIADQVSRICTDGSDRMPKFLLPSLIEALETRRPHRWLTLAVAGWFRYLRGIDEDGQKIVVADPLSSDLQSLANEGRNNPRPLLSLHQLFGALGQNEQFVSELAEVLEQIETVGAKATLIAATLQS